MKPQELKGKTPSTASSTNQPLHPKDKFSGSGAPSAAKSAKDTKSSSDATDSGLRTGGTNKDTLDASDRDSLLRKGVQQVGDALERVGETVERFGLKRLGQAIEGLGDRIEHLGDRFMPSDEHRRKGA